MSDESEIQSLLHDLGSRYAIPRRKAINALVEVGAPAVPGLIAQLNDKNPEAQKAAVEALERIATPAALAAVAHWRDKMGDDASV
ncbi:MAG: HEAT repeat domain-containing protein [Chloroflexi bacterium]|nr:HEAT repeat domain-containing protein [Chloroflexota bacterium]